MNNQAFWNFALERQAIWHRRFIEKLPAPWTMDPVLQKYKFTNCQRELDWGTQFILSALEEHRDATTDEKVLNIFLYRSYNVPNVPWVTGTTVRNVIRDRNQRWEAGETIFTNAWMITGGNVSPAARLEKAAESWNPMYVIDAAKEAESLRTVYEAVRKQPFFGGVTVSWQVALDLTYVFKNLSDDKWIPEPSVLLSSRKGLGTKEHGPRAAAKLLAPELQPIEVIHYLRDHQPTEWTAVAWDGKPRLSLADVEHTLCEFCKYHGISNGNRTGRKFTPRFEQWTSPRF